MFVRHLFVQLALSMNEESGLIKARTRMMLTDCIIIIIIIIIIVVVVFVVVIIIIYLFIYSSFAPHGAQGFESASPSEAPVSVSGIH
jgi:flagellar basal body-associated protein FliL